MPSIPAGLIAWPAPTAADQPQDRCRIGEDLRRDFAEPGEQLSAVELRRIEPAQQGIVVQEEVVDPVLQRLRVGEVAHPDRAAADLVLVSRADAAAGGADL